ncbi:hypothetical protein BCR44DRAFT_1447857 [Catenaria anguillulae PL171]|uniref:Secreted protein n=1 Tax=Catenaria anguillulae PL171 TaxID=765915 RepID=A0A1Y2H5E3_9FUNG|nr:hypothetical protein BCR44DRAFT_1447857 [Catenaria anguillulae PL171]
MMWLHFWLSSQRLPCFTFWPTCFEATPGSIPDRKSDGATRARLCEKLLRVSRGNVTAFNARCHGLTRPSKLACLQQAHTFTCSLPQPRYPFA